MRVTSPRCQVCAVSILIKQVCAPLRIMQGEESWEKVAVILAAIDRSLGIDLDVAIRNVKKGGSTKVGNGSTCTCRPQRQASSEL